MLQNIMIWGNLAKLKIKDIFFDEKGEVNILAMIILLVIAILLAVAFRKQIGDLVDKLFKSINGEVDNVTKPFSSGAPAPTGP